MGPSEQTVQPAVTELQSEIWLLEEKILNTKGQFKHTGTSAVQQKASNKQSRHPDVECRGKKQVSSMQYQTLMF